MFATMNAKNLGLRDDWGQTVESIPWRGANSSGITYTVSSAPAGAMSYSAAALCNKTAS